MLQKRNVPSISGPTTIRNRKYDNSTANFARIFCNDVLCRATPEPGKHNTPTAVLLKIIKLANHITTGTDRAAAIIEIRRRRFRCDTHNTPPPPRSPIDTPGSDAPPQRHRRATPNRALADGEKAAHTGFACVTCRGLPRHPQVSTTTTKASNPSPHEPHVPLPSFKCKLPRRSPPASS